MQFGLFCRCSRSRHQSTNYPNFVNLAEPTVPFAQGAEEQGQEITGAEEQEWEIPEQRGRSKR